MKTTRTCALRLWSLPAVVSLCATVLSLTPLPVPAAEDTVVAGPPVVQAARADLAQRLKLDLQLITVDSVEPVIWPSAALGLPKPGMLYAEVLTPGLLLRLQGGNHLYRYHAAGTRFVFAGREELWRYSAAYIHKVENEPNLNGDLYKVSLLGTGPRLLLPAVHDFVGHPSGAILATRRTSRSGFDLLYRTPDGEVSVLHSALDYSGLALSPDGTRYAVAARRSFALGGKVEVRLGTLPEQPDTTCPAPSEGRVQSLFWSEGDLPCAVVLEGEELRVLQLTRAGDKYAWEPSSSPVPDALSILLNRSYTLEAQQEKDDQGKPVTVLAMVHFTGTQEEIARVPGLEVKHLSLTPGDRFALLVGTRSDKLVGVTVDTATGEVYDTVPEALYRIRLLAQPAEVPVVAPYQAQ